MSETLTNFDQSAQQQPPKYDAAIVLGKNIGIGWHREQIQQAPDHLSDHSRMSVLAAGMLYNSGEVRKIIFSTGQTAGEDIPSEASLMRDKLKSIWPSIPDEHIVLEETSSQTKENAIEVKRILDEHPDLSSLALVTVGYHLNRSEKLFRRAGVIAKGIASEDVVGKLFPKLVSRYKRGKAYIAESLKEKIGTPIQLYAGSIAGLVERYVKKSRS